MSDNMKYGSPNHDQNRGNQFNKPQKDQRGHNLTGHKPAKGDLRDKGANLSDQHHHDRRK